MIEKLSELTELTEQEKITYPMWLVHIHDKLNELIDAHNKLGYRYEQHMHHAGELRFGTELPNEPIKLGELNEYICPE